MDFNTNYSSFNRSAVSFGARFNTDLPVSVKNVSRLANIKDLFAQKTGHYASDTLTLTMCKDPSFSEFPVLTTGAVGVDGDYKYSHIVSGLDEMMELMSDNAIVKKFINYFKMMKKEEAFDKYIVKINKDIERLKAVKSKQEKQSEYCLAGGHTGLSAQFKTLANRSGQKLEALRNDKIKQALRYMTDMDKIAENEPDLGHVSECVYDCFGRV